MTCLHFAVIGRPQTAGSKTIVPTVAGPRVVDGGSKAARQAKQTWRGDVRDAALKAIGDEPGWPSDGPFMVDVVFAFCRPKSHYGQGRNERVLKATAPHDHLQDPDASKVWRAAEDALTGVVWRDDNAITDQRIRKFWADRFTADEGVSLIVRCGADRSSLPAVPDELEAR